eukprot:CAMPEP_0174262858 /NCGR_PEP_ID=MMETSP0439-20130205/15957_1 /TAXON_ID=0 /ORGANISM="Stereomyxa ramosa, Strain Chinc5" /LENGTH=51 /DNA_ID=CAMNT_0015347871 /DNA_START=82 /DNA_END=234 /DNA_ORIENTATION=+
MTALLTSSNSSAVSKGLGTCVNSDWLGGPCPRLASLKIFGESTRQVIAPQH